MKLVIVGNGMVGQRFLEQLVSRMSGGSPEITVFCGEPRPAYDRVQLTSFFSGKSAADLSLVPAGFFEQHGIALRLGDKAVAIDRTRKLVELVLIQRMRCQPAQTAADVALGQGPALRPEVGRRRRQPCQRCEKVTAHGYGLSLD